MNNNAIVPFSAHNAVELVKQLRLAVDILRGSGELVAGIDYGRIPGTGDKDTLLLPGMEKLCRALNAVPEYLERHVERDYDKPLFHYEYECRLVDADTGQPIPGGRGLGLCTSRESGFAWRFVQAHELPPDLDMSTLQKQGGKTSEFDFAINKAETSGKYGKPAEYWQAFRNAIAAGTAVKGERETARGMSPTWEIDTTVYRIPNPAIYDQINAIMKRAKKRALGDAIKGAANVSAYFTVDMEDFVPGTVINPDGNVVQGTFSVVEQSKSASEPSAGVRGAGLPQQQSEPPPVSYDDFPDIGAPAETTDSTTPDEYAVDALIVSVSKTAKQFALRLAKSGAVLHVADVALLDGLFVGQTPAQALQRASYPVSWVVKADKDAQGNWEIREISVPEGEPA